jgi:pimeloyl-ACP methyl ester carboxylesterase
MPTERSTMVTPDGRQLEYLVIGPADGQVLVFHSGSPEPAVDFSGLTGAATALGLRTVSYSRPGFGASTEQPGRRVADAADDVAALLDELGVREFLTLGWSGGGPHALACAALLPGRCRAATLLASIAPYGAPGLDFMAGMDADNIEEWDLAVAGFDAIDAFLQPLIEDLRQMTVASLTEGMSGMISSVDLAALTGAFADELVGAFRGAVENGIAGWRDDDLAFVQDWGFGLAEIGVPVAVWHGRRDQMIPFAHGEWLAAAIPGAEAHWLADDGHISPIRRMDEIIGDLVALGGQKAG